MPAIDHFPVNSRLVHKEHLDDVLVSNIRSELPTKLNKDALPDCDLSNEERALVSRHFCAVTNGSDGQILLRKSVPATLPADAAEAEGFEWIADYYSPSVHGLQLEAKYIPEHLEELLAARFLDPHQAITAATRHRLALVTDRLPCNARTNKHSMTLINDVQHYFFYRKHHEHVPGMMLIEAARQAIYAQYYRTSTEKRGEITLSMKSVNCDFADYVESNYPVTITVDTTEVPAEIGKAFVRRTARLYQRGRYVAAVDIIGSSIKMKLFRRLRNITPDADEWFVPIKGFAPSVLFLDGTGQRMEGKLCKVSQSGMDIVFPKQLEGDAALDFVISVDGIGYINGKARPRALEVVSEGVMGRLDMFDLSLDGKRKWFEAIKNYSHIETRAGA
jgi:hypothetical protein